MKKSKRTEPIVIAKKPLRRGHQNHIAGSGAHDDRRTKRLKTRAAKQSVAVREW